MSKILLTERSIESIVRLLNAQSGRLRDGGVGSAGADPGGGVRGVRGEGVQGGDYQEHRAGGWVAITGPYLLVLPRQRGSLSGGSGFADTGRTGGGGPDRPHGSPARGTAAEDRTRLLRLRATRRPNSATRRRGSPAPSGGRRDVRQERSGEGSRVPQSLSGAPGRDRQATLPRRSFECPGLYRNARTATRGQDVLPGPGRRRSDRRGSSSKLGEHFFKRAPSGQLGGRH